MSHALGLPAFLPASQAPLIQVIYPSGALNDQQRSRLEEGLAALQAANPRARIRWSPEEAQRRARGYLAGDDTARLQELIAAIDDDEVEIIWAARGGFGAGRIAQGVLAHLRVVSKRRRPKLLVGFSDISALLCAWVQVGWPAVHGPVLTSLCADSPVQVDLPQLWATLTGELCTVHIPQEEREDWRGPVVGGNLTVLASLVGSGLLWRDERLIWLFEDLHEVPYQIDRSLTQLRAAGVLSAHQRLWLGRFSHPQLPQLSESVRALCAEDFRHPVLMGAPAGHEGPCAALPLGVSLHIQPSQGRLSWQNLRSHA